MHTRQLILTTAIAIAANSSAHSQVISVNFEGLESNAASTNLLEPADVAGLIPSANWNNAAGATGTITGAIDTTGAITSANVAWTGQAIWSWERSGDAVPANPDGTMFNGYLDTTGNDGNHTISVTGVPYSSYDVIVYIDGEHTGSNRPLRVNVNPGGSGDNPALDVFSAEGANWNGTFVPATATGLPGTVNANYARFTGLTDDNFEIFAEAENFRAAINGFQIVAVLDADGDGLPTAWEIANGLDDTDDGSLNPDNGPDGDPDEDGSNNLQELNRLTDPQDDDSDDDTLKDGVESGSGTFVDETDTGTNPLDPDSDDDTLSDGDEVNGASPSNPTLADTDDDGLRDGKEIELGTNPSSADSDNDTFSDTLETALQTDPTSDQSTPNLNLSSINLNFEGLDNIDSATNAPNLLTPTDVAGLYPASNWNNITGFATVANNLTDATGAPTPVALDLTGQAVWSWEQSNDAVPPNPTGFMFNGYLDTIDNNGTHTIALTGIPYSNYDVIVYVDGEHNATAARPGSVSLDATGEEYFVNDQRNWNGVFSQGFGTDVATATPGANFVIFNDVTESDITLVATARNFRIAVNAIQIIGTPANPLRITDFNYDPDTNQAALTWNSINGVEYAIQKSATMDSDWEEVGDFSATGSTSTFTVTSDQIPDGINRLFFRIVVIE